MHYVIQIELADLQAAAISMFNPVTAEWEKQWVAHGGDRYSAIFTNGQVALYGPVYFGNPTKSWFEVQCRTDALAAELDAISNDMDLMKDKARAAGLMRLTYQGAGRKMVRNGAGNPVGPEPRFCIAGTNPAASLLGNENADDAQELLDLECVEATLQVPAAVTTFFEALVASKN